MSPVHPLFKPLLAALSGKETAPAVFTFDVEFRATFDEGHRNVHARWQDRVQASTEEEACDLAARAIMQDIGQRCGTRPSRVEVIRSDMTREAPHG